MDKHTIPLTIPSIGETEIQSVLGVLDAHPTTHGSQTEAFEREFAILCGTEYAVATDSGTSALLVALLAHEIGEGTEVIATSFTSLATVNAILAARAVPVFVDIEADTYNLDVGQVGHAITPRTKAILPVHIFGHMCDMDALTNIANDHGLLIIEDVCQAMGASYAGKMAGSFGAGAFSLSTTAMITSFEGGVITTDDAEIAERCRMIRNHGMDKDGKQVMLGYEYGMSDMHASLARTQLKRLDELVRRRRENAAYLNDNIKSASTPVEKPGYRHVWNKYTLCLREDRDQGSAIKRLGEVGIEAEVFYPQPVYAHTPAREVTGDVRLPVVEKMAKRVISLPVHPQLTSEELEIIVTEANKIL